MDRPADLDQLEVTGTFKQVKGELRRQGFDPAAVPEPLFVLPARKPEYVPVTAELHAAIVRGELDL